MLLLNRDLILKYQKLGFLTIDPIDEEDNLEANFYYFRLGKLAKVWDGNEWKDQIFTEKKNVLKIPAKGYALIVPLEKFHCSDRVLALFGQSSDVFLKGFRLSHSPTIDPGFAQGKPGYLWLGLENLMNADNAMRVGDRIGKVLFFDVAYTSVLTSFADGELERRFQERQKGGPKPKGYPPMDREDDDYFR